MLSVESRLTVHLSVTDLFVSRLLDSFAVVSEWQRIVRIKETAPLKYVTLEGRLRKDKRLAKYL